MLHAYETIIPDFHFFAGFGFMRSGQNSDSG
jgi:hypothetical protein